MIKSLKTNNFYHKIAFWDINNYNILEKISPFFYKTIKWKYVEHVDDYIYFLL